MVTADRPLGPGPHRLGFAYERRLGLAGHGTLSIDGAPAGQGEIARFTFTGFNGTGAGLTCGYETGPAVGPGYRAPSPSPGTSPGRGRGGGRRLDGSGGHLRSHHGGRVTGHGGAPGQPAGEGLHEAAVAGLPLDRLAPLIGRARFAELEAAATRARGVLGRRVAWNVNSTAAGGGVAEMLGRAGRLRPGRRARRPMGGHRGRSWFFAITKRLHNRLHGIAGDGGSLGPAEGEHYRAVTGANAADLVAPGRPGDVVVLHDPQTAGLAGRLARGRGPGRLALAHRHRDGQPGGRTRRGAFCAPTSSRPTTSSSPGPPMPRAWLAGRPVAVIAPSIDPFSVKNRSMTDDERVDLLTGTGLVAGTASRPAMFRRADGTPASAVHRATVVSATAHCRDLENLVIQVSRWDRLKDMAG